jgi:hypothetical protein
VPLLQHSAVKRCLGSDVTPRISEDPIFDEYGESRKSRELALQHAPLAFKRRILFTPAVDLPLSLRAGRPTKSNDEKRRANAERQRRFRKAHFAELSELRKLVHKQAALISEAS